MINTKKDVLQREAQYAEGGSGAIGCVTVPDYLEKTYWWAYTHPNAVRVFERQWLVNSILWGNYRRLRNAALNAFGDTIIGRTLQMACVYGDLTENLLGRHHPAARLDVIDVAPEQIKNLRKKTAGLGPLGIHQQNAAHLQFEAATFDQVLMFFLLHEMPQAVRRQALAEAWRVLKPGGKLVLMDYHRPRASNPLRYVMAGVLRLLEPYALDLWHNDLAHWLPQEAKNKTLKKQLFFGDLYQLVVISR